MATETIPVIDLGPFLAGEDGCARPHGQGTPLRADRDRLLLHRQSRRAAGKDPRRLRAGEALPRPAGREEARTQDRPQQHRLPAAARQHAAHLDDPDRHQAQSQRGLLRQARDAGRSSRRAGRSPLPRRQSLAAEPAGLPRDRRRLLRHAGTAGAEDGAALRPRPRAAGRVFRRSVQGVPVLAAHDALPAPGRARSSGTSSAWPRTPTRASSPCSRPTTCPACRSAPRAASGSTRRRSPTPMS